jgi:hypothetical protein
MGRCRHFPLISAAGEEIVGHSRCRAVEKAGYEIVKLASPQLVSRMKKKIETKENDGEVVV